MKNASGHRPSNGSLAALMAAAEPCSVFTANEYARKTCLGLWRTVCEGNQTTYGRWTREATHLEHLQSSLQLRRIPCDDGDMRAVLREYFCDTEARARGPSCHEAMLDILVSHAQTSAQPLTDLQVGIPPLFEAEHLESDKEEQSQRSKGNPRARHERVEDKCDLGLVLWPIMDF